MMTMMMMPLGSKNRKDGLYLHRCELCPNRYFVEVTPFGHEHYEYFHERVYADKCNIYQAISLHSIAGSIGNVGVRINSI